MTAQSIREMLATIAFEVRIRNRAHHDGSDERLSTIESHLRDCDILIADYRYETELKKEKETR